MTTEGSVTRMPLVYLVDDEPEVAVALSSILRDSGCRVKTFLSGSDLIACPDGNSPDVVVTDYVMQPIDGLRVAAWVRCTYPQARVIMITADEHLARSAAGNQLPFLLLEKPLNSAGLIAAVHGVDFDDAAHCA
jgi:two-component system, NtrC family, response regulator HydG